MNTTNYVIFATAELDKIDFTQVQQTSADTCRRSVDGAKTLVKWYGDMPSCITTLTSKGAVMSQEEILSVMATAEWTDPDQKM
jgi:hypothetical protein